MFYPLRLWQSKQLIGRGVGLGVLGGLLVVLSGCFSQRFKAYYVASSSMMPTLEVDDRVLTTLGIYQTQSPQRGDIVLFTFPPPLDDGAVSVSAEEVGLSRIIGLPGETFEVRNGQILIDDAPLPEPYISEPPAYAFELVTIPEDAYVVLGDNRNFAFDSHAWGFLPAANITGKVQSIYWPPGRFGSIYD